MHFALLQIARSPIHEVLCNTVDTNVGLEESILIICFAEPIRELIAVAWWKEASAGCLHNTWQMGPRLPLLVAAMLPSR